MKLNKTTGIVNGVKLKEVSEILNGFAFKSALFNDGGIGLPLIRIRNLLEGETDTYYSGKYESRYVVRKGDFLISMDGEFKIFEWKSNEALLNQRVCKLTLNKRLVDPKYVYYMISRKLKDIEDKTPFVTVKHISSDQISNIELLLPSLIVQKQIVSVLEKAEALKKKREEADKLTKEYMQSVFYEMFYNKGFEEVELGGIAEFIRGPFGGSLKKEIFKKEGYLVYEQYHPINNDFSFGRYFIDKKKFNEMKRFEVKSGDLLISCSGTMGKIAIVPENHKEGIINQALLKLTLNKNKINNYFLKFLLETNDMQKKYFSNQAGAVIQNVVSVKILKQIKIPLPPISLQQKFASIVEKIERLKEKQKESRENLDNIFNVLMQKAFRGELVK